LVGAVDGILDGTKGPEAWKSDGTCDREILGANDGDLFGAVVGEGMSGVSVYSTEGSLLLECEGTKDPYTEDGLKEGDREGPWVGGVVVGRGVGGREGGGVGLNVGLAVVGLAVGVLVGPKLWDGLGLGASGSVGGLNPPSRTPTS
jgi:hypothetical protein